MSGFDCFAAVELKCTTPIIITGYKGHFCYGTDRSAGAGFWCRDGPQSNGATITSEEIKLEKAPKHVSLVAATVTKSCQGLTNKKHFVTFYLNPHATNKAKLELRHILRQLWLRFKENLIVCICFI